MITQHIKYKMNHWIIRIGNGENFKNSKYPFWGLINHWKPHAAKIKENDILWFLCNKDTNDNKILGMARFTKMLDKRDEVLINIETTNNIEQGWDCNSYDIELHYTDLYDTSEQNIKIHIRNQVPVINYYDNTEKIKEDLEKHYNGFKFYAKTI